MRYYASINGDMQRISEEQKQQIEAENRKIYDSPFENWDKVTAIFQFPEEGEKR